MNTLLLLRHAKSSWDDTGVPDIARPLNDRGLKAASLIARHLVAEGLGPDHILCSSARRARETLAALVTVLPGSCGITIDDRLYADSEVSYRPIIIESSGTARTLLVVGHNPAIRETALELIGKGPPRLRAAIDRKVPTGALIRIGFAQDTWSDLAPGSGTLQAYVRPRDLAHLQSGASGPIV